MCRVQITADTICLAPARPPTFQHTLLQLPSRWVCSHCFPLVLGPLLLHHRLYLSGAAGLPGWGMELCTMHSKMPTLRSGHMMGLAPALGQLWCGNPALWSTLVPSIHLSVPHWFSSQLPLPSLILKSLIFPCNWSYLTTHFIWKMGDCEDPFGIFPKEKYKGVKIKSWGVKPQNKNPLISLHHWDEWLRSLIQPLWAN